MDIMKDLKSLKCGQVNKNVLLSKYTTYRLDEKALCLVTPNNLNDLIKLIKYLKDNHFKYKIIGNGSNLIFAHYYDGILIKLDKLSKLIINNDTHNIVISMFGFTIPLKMFAIPSTSPATILFGFKNRLYANA